MNEIVIKKRNFEIAKNRLKKFSMIKEAELKIEKVKTDGGFLGLGDHRVTGYELNNRMETIQKHLIDINTTNNKTIKEFREIYNALDALDKDYMASIVASVNAIEKTSNDVRTQQGILNKHHNKLQEQQNKLDVHQNQIVKNVDNINKTVLALKKFKEKLDSLKHLTDIDKIWSDCIEIHNEMRSLSNSLTISVNSTKDSIRDNIKNVEELKNLSVVSEQKIEGLAYQLNDILEKLELVMSFTSEVEQIKHLKDIDEMWESLANATISIRNNSEELENIQRLVTKSTEDINRLRSFVEKLSKLEYLMEVDTMWKKGENQALLIKELTQTGALLLERIDSNTSELNDLNHFKQKLSNFKHLEHIDNVWEDVQKHTSQLAEAEVRDEKLANAILQIKEELNNKLELNEQAMNTTIEALSKKIKYAYWLAGGTAGFAIIELIILLTKVI